MLVILVFLFLTRSKNDFKGVLKLVLILIIHSVVLVEGIVGFPDE